VAADHLSHHGDRAADAGSSNHSTTRRALPSAAAALRGTPGRGKKKFPKLQLRLLPPLPEAKLLSILHVLSAYQVQVQAAAARRDVGKHGAQCRMADHTAGTSGTVRRAA